MTPASTFPKVTVVTATYNRADLLPETMDSILAQDYPNLEYIVLDDGSSDNTIEVMKPYLEKYPHIIRFESHANMGEARTVNKAWEMANGDYFMVVSSDDPQPSRQLLAKSVAAMQANINAVATYPDWHIIDHASKPVKEMKLGDWDLHYMVRNVVCVLGPGALINRKKLFGKIPYLRTPKYRFVSDYDCWLRIGLHGDFVHIPEFLGAWREHDGAATVVNNGIKISSELKALYDEYFANYELPPAIRAEEARVKSYLYMMAAKHILRTAPHKTALYLTKALFLCPSEFLFRFDSAARAGVKKVLRAFKRPSPKSPSSAPARPKILLVANQSSVHTVGWIEMMDKQGFDITLFCIHYGLPLPGIKGIRIVYPVRYLYLGVWFRRHILRKKAPCPAEPPRHFETIFPLPGIPMLTNVINGIKRTLFGKRAYKQCFGHGPYALNKLIDRLQPDLIHSMDFQQTGYMVARAKAAYKGRGRFPKWIAMIWGSDIYYFGKQPEHQPELAAVLRGIDYFSSECGRDVFLARDLGFNGRVLPPMSVSGGYDMAAIKPVRNVTLPSARKIIMVKGYQHFVGRALTALAAVEAAADALQGYKIVVFSGTPFADVVSTVNRMAQNGIDITCLPQVSKATMLDYFNRARIYLGVSMSDGIGGSLLESMVYGTFPIQTNTSCCDEWILDGETGFIIPPEDVDYIASRLREAATNDALVDAAATKNWAIACERLDINVMRVQVDAYYKTALKGDAL